MRAAFAAASAVELTESHLRLAGRPVTYRIAGAALATRTLAPLAHLADRDPPDQPTLTVELWDEAATGVPLPFAQPPRSVRAEGDRLVTHSDAGVLTTLDRERGLIAGWRERADVAPEEGWRTLPWLLPVWYLDRGAQMIHGGLVALGGRGVLLVGEGGSGKSTTCLACAASGLEFLGDDFVAIEETGDGWLGHSISRTARTTYDTLERHPKLAAGLEVGESEGKNIVFIGDDSARASVPIDAILLPRTGAARSGLRAASGAEVVTAFLPTSLVGSPGSGADRMARLGRLARSLPASWLELSGSPAEAATVVRGVLEELASR